MKRKIFCNGVHRNDSIPQQPEIILTPFKLVVIGTYYVLKEVASIHHYPLGRFLHRFITSLDWPMTVSRKLRRVLRSYIFPGGSLFPRAAAPGLSSMGGGSNLSAE